MKQILEASKRALVLLLTGAMIATSVPADIFAAPLADDDVIIEEAVDAVAEDAVVEEEVVADATEDAVESLAASDEDAADPDVVDPDDYTDDVQFVFLNATAGGTDTDGTYTHVSILDGETRDGATGFYGWDDDTVTVAYSGTWPQLGLTGTDNTPATATKKWDSNQDYVFTLSAENGYVFNTAAKTAAERTELAKRLVKIWWVKDATTATKCGYANKVTDSEASYGSQYKVEISDDYTYATVTVDAGYIQNMRDAYVADRSSSAWDCPAIVVAPYPTLNQRDAKDHIKLAEDNASTDGIDESEILWGWGAQPDVYTVALDTAYDSRVDVNVKLREATFDSNMEEWTVEPFEFTYKPITGAQIYYTGKENTADNRLKQGVAGGDEKDFVFYYDSTAKRHKLKITTSGVQKGYKYGTLTPDASGKYLNGGLTVLFLSNAYALKQVNEDGEAESDSNKQIAFYRDGYEAGKDIAITGIDKAVCKIDTEEGILGQGVYVTFESEAEGRDLYSIDVTFGDTGNTKNYLSGNNGSGINLNPEEDSDYTDSGEVAPVASIKTKTIWIPRNEIATNMVGTTDDTIYVQANVRETLTWKVDSTKYVLDYENASQTTELYNTSSATDTTPGDGVPDDMETTEGVATLHPYTGKALTFPVYAVSGRIISKVEYKNDTVGKNECTNNGDGTYTIPAGVLVEPTEVIITSDPETSTLREVTVYVSDSIKGLGDTLGQANDTGVNVDSFTIMDTKYGENLLGTATGAKYKGDTVEALATEKTKNPNFSFFVKPTGTNKFVINKVSWRKADGLDGEFTEIKPSETIDGLYSMVNPESNIEILVEVNKLVKVDTPSNTKAIVTINGKDYRSGQSAYVQYNRPLDFAVRTTDEAAIAVTEMGFKVDSGSRSTINANSSKVYQIGKADVTATSQIKIYAQTEETRVNGDGYEAYFTASSNPNGNWRWDDEYADATKSTGTALHTSIDTVLRVNQNTYAGLAPEIWATGGASAAVESSAIDGIKTTYTVKSGSGDFIEVSKAGGDQTVKNATIDAKKEGKDSISFVIKQASKDENKDENLLKVTGDQAIEVTPHFVITLTHGTKEYIDHVGNTYVASVINGATGLSTAYSLDGKDSTQTGIVNLIKATPAITDTIAWSSAKGLVHLDPSTTGSDPVKTDIWADGSEDNPYSLFVKIKDTDNRDYTSNTLSLWPVDYKNYIIVPELTVNGGILNGGRYFGVDAVAEDAYGAPALTKVNSLGTTDLNKATLSFKVYEGNTTIIKNEGAKGSTTDRTLYGDVNTEADIESALDLPVAEDESKWAREVTGAIDWSYTLSTGFAGLTVTDKGNGVYDLEAVANDRGTFNVKAVIDRINVSLNVPFDVCDTTELMKVNLFLDDTVQVEKNGNVVNQKLKDSYFEVNKEKNKTIWASENDLNAQYVGGAKTSEAAGNIKEDGYQLKLANGSALTLPTEDDLDSSIYKNEHKARTLVGWLVSPNAPGFVSTAVAPDTALTTTSDASVIDAPKYNTQNGTGTITFYAPGETIVLLDDNQKDQTYNIAAAIYPVWADRYSITAATAYVDREDTYEIKNWSDDLFEQVDVTAPIDTALFSPGNTATYNEDASSAPYVTETGLAASVSKNFATNVKLVATKALTGVSAITSATDVTVKTNKTYPGFGEWKDEGTVTWYSYDALDELGGDNHVKYSHIKAGVLSSDEQVKLSRNEVLSVENGVIQGKEAGSAYVYATFTDASGSVYWLDRPILVTVKENDQAVTADISNVATQAAIKDGIEVGETVQVTTGGISITDGTKIPENTDVSTGTYTWNVTSEDGAELEFSEVAADKGKNQGALLPRITGKKAGTAKVSLTYTAANGKSVTSGEITIKVLPAKYTVEFTDKDGNPVDHIEAKATNATNAKAGVFYVTVRDEDGAPVSGGKGLTFTSKNVTVAPVAVFETNSTGTYREVKIGTTNGSSVTTIGESEVTAIYTSAEDKSYEAVTTLKTYYEVKFGGAQSAVAASEIATNTEPFTNAVYKASDNTGALTDASKISIVNDAGTTLSDDNGEYVLKVFKENLTENNRAGYTVSFDGINMKYVGLNSDKISFIGWSTTGAAVRSDAVVDSLKVQTAATVSSGEYVGNKKIIAIFGYKGAESVAVNNTKIVLDAAGNKVSGTATYRQDAANLKISVGPKDSSDVVYIKTSADGFLGYTNGEFVRGGDGAIAASGITAFTTSSKITGGTNFAKLTMGERDTTQDYAIGLVTLGNTLAGKATLTVFTAASDKTATVDVIVKGLYTVDGELHYMTATGDDLMNSSVTVGDDTYYFDEYGKRILNGVATNEAGKKVIVKNGKAETGLVTNGDGEGHNFYAAEDGSLYSGKFTVGNDTYYADPENLWLVSDAFIEFDGVLNYFDNTGKLVKGNGTDFTTITSTATSVRQGVFGYMIATDGAIKSNELIAYGTEGKKVFVNSYGQRVTAGMATDGKYTDPVTGAVYLIDADGYAEADKAFYFTGYTAGAWSWNDGAPSVEVTMNYAADDGDTTPTEKITLLATTTDPDTVNFKTYTATTTAKFVRKGATEKEVVTLTKKFDKDGKSAEYTYKSHKFEWPKELGDAVKPVVTAKVTYSVKEDGVAKPDETIDTTVGVGEAVEQGVYKVFTASLTTIDGLTKTEDGKYNKKSGKLNDSGESGKTPSEADDSVSINLFYTDVELSIPTGDWTTEGASGKWTSYYKVDDSGAVTVLASTPKDRKAAASAANSLIVLPVKDSEGAVVGDFEYQLPVFYQKPALKLTSTSATIKTGAGEQTVSTIVTEKKSNGLFEAIDLSSQDTEKTPFFGSTTAEAGDALGEIAITTSAAVKNTKIAVQLDNWSEKVELKYAVKEVNKDVLTASAKQVVMNVNGNGGEDQEVTIKLNNGDINSESGVAVKMPKNDPGVEIEGIEEGKLTSSTLTFKYKDGAAPTSGNYSYKFSVGKASVSVKLVVNKNGLDKAVALGVKTKMNLMTGQKMVVVPTLKGIGGPIEDVEFDETSAALFEAEYNDEINQIIITPVDASKLDPKTKYATTLTVKAGGVDCPTALKIQLDKKKPTVKIAKVTIPKEKLSDGTGEGISNILATYKVGTKTFAVAPTKVEFLDGKTVLTVDDEGWATSSKAKVKVQYNAEDGTISVKAVSGGKGGSVKVNVYFGTEIVSKSLTVKKGK